MIPMLLPLSFYVWLQGWERKARNTADSTGLSDLNRSVSEYSLAMCTAEARKDRQAELLCDSRPVTQFQGNHFTACAPSFLFWQKMLFPCCASRMRWGWVTCIPRNFFLGTWTRTWDRQRVVLSVSHQKRSQRPWADMYLARPWRRKMHICTESSQKHALTWTIRASMHDWNVPKLGEGRCRPAWTRM